MEWARVTDYYLPGLAVSPKGDCYMYGVENDNILTVAKISSSGDLVWSYDISLSSGGNLNDASWSDMAMDSANWLNDNLYLAARYTPIGSPQLELIIKVADQQILGEYGPFIFSESNVTVETVTPSDAGYPCNTDHTNNLLQAPVNLEMFDGISQPTQITNLP